MIADYFNLTSTLVNENGNISFIGTFKTSFEQHPPKLPLSIKINNANITNYSMKELSSKEVLFTFQHQNKQTNATIFISAINSDNTVTKMEAVIISVPNNTITFKPDFRALEKRLNQNKRKNLLKYKNTQLFSIEQRIQKNGSFALIVDEQIDFDFVSSAYQVFKVSFIKRMDHPEVCANDEILPNIGSKCENRSSPVVNQEKNKIHITFRSIGLYTLIIHLRDKNNQEYYQTVVSPNYLIVQELITKACMIIKSGDIEKITALGSLDGPNMNFGAVYEWVFNLGQRKVVRTSKYIIYFIILL